MGARRGGTCCVLAASLVMAVGARTADAGPPLRRDLGAYFAFGLRSIGLKNISVTGACNAGVDCAQPNANSDCGVVTHEDANYADGSQIAGDRARFNTGGAIIFQLFSNAPTGRIFGASAKAIKPIYLGPKHQQLWENVFEPQMQAAEQGKSTSQAAWDKAVKDGKALAAS